MNNVGKLFAKYVSANVLGMIGISCYILADTFFIANGVGANGLTALNLAIPVYNVINGAGLMIGIGGATRFSLSKDKKVFTRSAYYVFILSLIFMAAGIFASDSIARVLGADNETIKNTSVYLKVILCFSPAFLTNNLLIAFVRNDSSPKLPMAAMILGSLSNVVLDYVFVFPLNMGMFGAAIATGIAPLVGISVSMYHFIKKRNTFGLVKCGIKLKKLLDISQLGLSSFINEISNAAVIVVFNMIILKIDGNMGVAAYGIVANIALVFLSVFTGISQGVQPIISSCTAKGETDNIKEALRYGVFTSLFVAAAIYTASFIFAESMASLFNSSNDPYLTHTAARGMRMYFISFIAAGLNILFSAYYSAVGRGRKGFLISFLRGFAVAIPSALVISELLGMDGVWLSAVASDGIVLLVIIISSMAERRKASHA